MKEIISSIAGLMTFLAPALQALHIIRTRNTQGLSITTYVLLVICGFILCLLGLEYGVVAMMTLNTVSMLVSIGLLYLISVRAAIVLLAAVISVSLAVWFILPGVAETLLTTTRWSEHLAFCYGMIAATTFWPQVIVTVRTRSVSAISLPNYLLMSCGMILWVVFAFLLRNWSLLFWNSLTTLAVLYILYMKLSGIRSASVAANVAT